MGGILIIVGLSIAAIGAGMLILGNRTGAEDKQITESKVTEKPVSEVKTEVEKPDSVEILQIKQEQEPEIKSSGEENPKEKGNSFEGICADILQTSGCRLIEWNQGATSPGGAYAENELKPDFLVSQKIGNRDIEYWVECKFRTSLPKAGFSLKDYQVDRYKEIQRESKKKIVIALGLGGSASDPLNIYMIPLDSLTRFKRIGHKYLINYKTYNFCERMESWFLNDVFNRNRN